LTLYSCPTHILEAKSAKPTPLPKGAPAYTDVTAMRCNACHTARKPSKTGQVPVVGGGAKTYLRVAKRSQHWMRFGDPLNLQESYWVILEPGTRLEADWERTRAWARECGLHPNSSPAHGVSPLPPQTSAPQKPATAAEKGGKARAAADAHPKAKGGAQKRPASGVPAITHWVLRAALEAGASGSALSGTVVIKSPQTLEFSPGPDPMASGALRRTDVEDLIERMDWVLKESASDPEFEYHCLLNGLLPSAASDTKIITATIPCKELMDWVEEECAGDPTTDFQRILTQWTTPDSNSDFTNEILHTMVDDILGFTKHNVLMEMDDNEIWEARKKARTDPGADKGALKRMNEEILRRV